MKEGAVHVYSGLISYLKTVALPCLFPLPNVAYWPAVRASGYGAAGMGTDVGTGKVVITVVGVLVPGNPCGEVVHPEHTRMMKKAPRAAIANANFIVDPLSLFTI